MKIFKLAAMLALTPLFANAGDWSFTPGEYKWKTGSSCGFLTVSHSQSFRYKFDRGCNGSNDYRAQNVYLRGDTIYIDQATLSLISSSEKLIRGKFKLGGNSNLAVFVLQD